MTDIFLGSEIMDIIIEIFIEIYMELMLLIVPEKNLTKKHILIAKIVAIIVLIGLFALVLWGVYLISDKNNMLGLLPITAAAVFSVIQIVLGIVLYNRNH